MLNDERRDRARLVRLARTEDAPPASILAEIRKLDESITQHERTLATLNSERVSSTAASDSFEQEIRSRLHDLREAFARRPEDARRALEALLVEPITCPAYDRPGPVGTDRRPAGCFARRPPCWGLSS